MELKLDQWATTPPAGYPGPISPPTGKRSAGFANGEEPPAGYFNHAWDALSDMQNELANLITGAGLTRVESDLAQVLKAIDVLIGRAQLKTALTTVRVIYDTAIGPQTLKALARAPGDTGKAIAVGTEATIQANSGPNTSFAAQTAGAPFTGDFTDITYDPTLGLFIAVGQAGEIQTSTGNGTWTRRASGGARFRKVLTNGLGLCVATGEGNVIKYSTNGTTWNTTTGPFESQWHTGLVFGEGVFVTVTDGGSIASSSDGVTWIPRRSDGGASGAGEVIYDPALGFIFGGNPEHDVYRSADGITWTQIHDQCAIYQSGLFGSPYGWLVMLWSAAGTSVTARYSATAVDAPADFIVDYVTTEQLMWMKFIYGQLWALGGTKIYLGGVL